MPRYQLHLFDSVGLSRDEERLELADLDAARGEAVRAVRSILSDEVKHGRVDLTGRIEITAPDQQVLAVLHFRDAVELVLPPDAGRS